MKINQPSVKFKLAGAFGALTLIGLILSGFSLRALINENQQFADYVDGLQARANQIEDVRTAISQRALGVRNLVLVTTPTDIDAEKDAVHAAEQKVEKGLEKFSTMISSAYDASDQERGLAAEIVQIEYQYRPVALDIDQLAENNQRDAAIAEIDTKCRPLLSALDKAVESYRSFVHQHTAQKIQDAENEFESQRSLLIAGGLVGVAMALLCSIIITRDLLRTLGAEPSELSQLTLRVAAGNLSPEPGANCAPAGSVLASMEEMRASLVHLIGQVHTAASSIATGSSQIAAGNVDLSARTEQQAASLEETAASMEELTSTVKQNAENSQLASSLSVNASDLVGRGNQVVSQLVEMMGDISARSTRIADITGMIEGISFQTNILALNAAVEAARAGEQGRGFAVVASEVRSLAQRSASAAKEIKDLIDASVQKIQDGSSLAHETGRTMSEVTQAVARVTGIMSEIAAASSEQSQGIEQVNRAITQMDNVTQQNAALVEEAAAASKSLEVQGQQLNRAISYFRMDSNAASQVTIGKREMMRT